MANERKEASRKEEGPDYSLDKAYKRERRGEGEITFDDPWFEEHEFKDLPEQNVLDQTDHFVVSGVPLDIIDKLYEHIRKTYD